MQQYIEMIVYCVILWMLSMVTAPAQTVTVTASDIVTATLILEAGGEYSEGAMQAVYEVIVNRSTKRELMQYEVCLERLQFSCWNGSVQDKLAQLDKAKRHPRWREAFAITLQPVTSYTGGADHYHADYCNPYWNKHMKITAKIGRHIFYK
jgi:N-acetylmuramoyl-L-alanine amidase